MHRTRLTLLASAGSLAIMVLIAKPADAAPVLAPTGVGLRIWLSIDESKGSYKASTNRYPAV